MPFAPMILSLLLIPSPADLGTWHKATSKEGGFSVMMPGKPEKKTINEQTDDGPAEVRALVLEVDGITFLATAATNSTKVVVDKDSPFFDTVRESNMTGKGRTLQKEQRGSFQKMPMCYFRYALTAPNGKPIVVQARYLIADPTHIYTLQVYVPKGMNIDTEVKRFFDSFDRIETDARSNAKKSAKGGAKEENGAIGPPIAAKWRSFTPPNKGFSVTMPGEPEHLNQDDAANSIKIDRYAADLGDRLYSAIAYEFPASIAKQEPGTVLENLCKAIAKEMNGKLVELKPVQDDGLEGREITFEFPGPDQATPVVAGRIRAYLVGTKAYVLMYNGLKGTSDTEEVRKYLNSFRRTKSASPAKTKGRS